MTTYEYDAAGTRVLKRGKYGTVQYVSDNYTVRNKDLISKHVFAGNTRLVSKVVMQEEKSGKMTATEQGSYYYHADHLGSSSVVTDGSGKFYEQIEYFPYGETWVHNKATSTQTSMPYKFTSKELDEETGLYYYGARYYDAKLSRWISTDPPMSRGDYFPVPPVNDKAKEKNSKLPGMGGVFNSINIDAYHYAGQNPVKMIDPDGNWGEDIHYGSSEFGGTLKWSQEVGFTKDVARIIAIANNDVDSGKTGPMPWQNPAYHFNTSDSKSGSAKDTRKIKSEQHLKNAISLMHMAKFIEKRTTGKNSNGKDYYYKEINSLKNEAYKELGRGLHALQDIDAHSDKYVDETLGVEHHWGPGKGGLKVDNPLESPERLQNTRQETIKYLNKFKKAIER